MVNVWFERISEHFFWVDLHENRNVIFLLSENFCNYSPSRCFTFRVAYIVSIRERKALNNKTKCGDHHNDAYPVDSVNVNYNERGEEEFNPKLNARKLIPNDNNPNIQLYAMFSFGTISEYIIVIIY